MSASLDDLAEARQYPDRNLSKTAEAADIDSAALMNEVIEYIRRFVAYPNEHCATAHTLWIMHTHCMEAWESTPRLAFLSPEPGSGKTRALEITETLVPRPVEAVSATPAFLFRRVADPNGLPTILFDEIDTIFGPRAKENEEIRGMLNAGHRRGAMAGRCVVRGKIIETEELPAYCAVALAGLGNLPDTILSRSIVIRMRRRAPSEPVEPYRRRVHAAGGYSLRDRMESWAAHHTPALGDAWPSMPDGIEDRNADVWEPLIAIADAVGGPWPDRVRVAAVALVADLRDDTPSLGIRLLQDIKGVFNAEVISTASLIDELCAIEESPWADIRGKPLDARRLANFLKPYGIKSKSVRVSETETPKGYERSHFRDSWDRYLPHVPPDNSATSATSATRCQKCAGEGCKWCAK